MHSIDRRTFTLAAGSATLAVSLAGCTGGETDDDDVDYVDEEPDYDGWLDAVPNYERTVDRTGRDEVRIDVGAGDGLQFDPPAVQVSSGTRVVWEWTGRGSEHDVVDEGGAFESERTAEAGYEFDHTFEETGTYTYFCTPHRSVGMKGAVDVV